MTTIKISRRKCYRNAPEGTPLAESTIVESGAVGVPLEVGRRYYLITNHTEEARYEFSRSPGRKNLSGQVCTDGWLGSSYGVDRYARGIVRVVGFTSRSVVCEVLDQ